MKRKRRQRWIAMLMAVVMLASTMGSTGLAQSLQTESHAAQDHRSTRETETTAEEIILPDRVKEWGEEYETVATQQEADALRTQDESKNLLITAKECTLSGLDYGEIAASATDKLDLSDVKAKRFTADQVSELRLSGTELEQLYVQTVKGQSVTLRMDAETKIPEIFLEGEGSVLLEGNGALGIVCVTGALEEVTVRATCSVINESGQPVQLEMPDGDQMTLAADQQEELVLSSYQVTFIADGQIYDSKMVKPGETIPFPEQNPEKDGFIFTSWYKDKAFTENCSQFAVAEGETTLYARFVDASEAIEVTFDTMGGRELEPQIFAKGENLLTRPINEIYTEKEGYTFGGWCTDPECTTAFSYTEPLEESLTLYAFFVSEEAQETEKDGTSADLADFDWQGTIPLRTEKEMTLDEVKTNVRVEAGSGALDPELDIAETEDGFAISGSYYEKDGETGFEPGATFSIIVSGGVHFADYSDDTDTAVVSVYKKQVEVVGFSDDMTYVLWDDVMEYQPVVSVDEASEEETDLETETFSETEKMEETELETVAEEVSETETESNQAVADPDGADAGEVEEAAYIPGEILVKNSDTTYQEGDIVAFYDGEIGRDEKNIDAYTEGSFDGYVLFAQILSVEDTADGVHLTYGYASPEDYLADFDVHVTDDVEMDQQLSEEDLEVLTSRLSRQVEENEELKAQMLVSVMSAPETQNMLDDLYGEGTYALAGMTATLTPGRPVVKLKVSGSEVTANISISATANIKKDGKNMLTVQPKLSFTQSLSVKTNVDGGKVWIDMSVTIRSMSKIELTVTATTGGKTTVFSKAKDTLSEIVKPEGIAEGDYESYDQSVSDLMDTMNSIVATSLKYNDLFDILLLNLKFSFYGIITVGFEVHLVGQVGVLATFGVEIVARSGERIGFKYNFLKFKGSSYTEKLESSVTNNIYLIGKVGARVGLRLTLSVTMCGIATAYITGSLYAYAELTGLFFNTTNLLSGANTNLGALKFEVGIDVVVSLGLKVRLIFKTIRKNWTVYTGRWPLWSTSVSSSMSYMDEAELAKLWEKSSANADHKTVFGFETIPMKTWNLMGGKCQKNEQLYVKSGKYNLTIENLKINGEMVPSDDPRNEIFTVGDKTKNKNPGYIYMDELLAGKYACSEVSLDLVLTYEDHASSALVKKQVQRFHLEKKCDISTTTQKVNVLLYDWCARNWGLEAAEWDNAKVFETSFSSSHMVGGISEANATGTLNLGEVIAAAQTMYPDLAGMDYGWGEPAQNGSIAQLQYASPRISNFCYMTTDNGVVRYDVYPGTQEYEVTYYLFIRRFEGFENRINYHIRLNSASELNQYEFRVAPKEGVQEETFTKDENGVYNLSLSRNAFDGTQRSIKMSVNGGESASTGFTVTGREYAKDVYLDMNFGKVQLNIASGEGIEHYQFVNPEQITEEGIQPGQKVELEVALKDGYGGLEVKSDNDTVEFNVQDNRISFVMPAQDLTITLQAYRKHSITYLYNYAGMGQYEQAYFTENEVTQEVMNPAINGLTFRGWYTTQDCSGDPYLFGDTLKTDVILYADWTCDVTISFGPVKGKAQYIIGEDEEQQIHPVFDGDESEYYTFTYSTLHVGDKLWNILTPEYEGYQFMDWYMDKEYQGQPVDLSTYILTGGVTLYARWAKELKITFDRNYAVRDGETTTVISEITGYSGYPITLLPEEPVREYYTFTGWYHNAAATDPFDAEKEILAQDETIYAGWKANTYPIHYELNGGQNAEKNPSVYTTEEAFELLAPTRQGYEFTGWTGTGLSDLTKTVSVTKGEGGERTYYANWKPVTYTLTYNKTYGSAKNNPDSYTIESKDIVLEQPVREKYEFTGWIGTDLTEAAKEVVIPSGSMGDRSYTALWTTTDPIEQILHRMELLADDHPYEKNLIDYLTEEDFYVATDTSIEKRNERLENALQSEVEAYLKSLIEQDGESGNYQTGEIGAYADQIQVKAVLKKAERTGDPDKQVYTWEIETIYTDDQGVEHKGRIDSYTASLVKMTPELRMPEMNRLTFGQKVEDSTVQYEGNALYTNKDLLVETQVPGTFDWKEEEREKVPFGRNNGTPNSEYAMIFTPDPAVADLYTPAEGKVPLLTQVGVVVICEEVNDRDYDPDSALTTGTAKLMLANEAGTAGTEELQIGGLLKEGTYTFLKDGKPDMAPEKDKKVLYQGYTLDTTLNTDDGSYGSGVYVILNPDGVETEATIYKIEKDKMNITLPTAAGEYEYGTLLEKVTFTGGNVTYGTGVREIGGTWSWTEPGSVLSTVPSQVCIMKFQPDDTVGYAEFTVNMDVTVKKKEIAVPEITGTRTYNGNKQYSGLKNTALYTVADNGGTEAGDYTATVTLNDPEHYCWKDITENSVTVPYTIGKAKATVSGTAARIELVYGQELTLALTEGQTEEKKMCLAGKNVTGLKVEFQGKTVPGKWEWDLTGTDAQPWDANETTPYTAKVKFTPDNDSIVVDEEKTVEVLVRKATPDYTNCGLTSDGMYQFSDPNAEHLYLLSCANIKAKGNPVNPVTGDTITGEWKWESENITPTESGNRNCVFEPRSGNYSSVSAPVYVEVKKPDKISYQVKAVKKLDYSTATTNGDAEKLFKNGITSNVFSGSTKGIMNAPVSVYSDQNSQTLKFKLSNSNYYIGAMKVSARGFGYGVIHQMTNWSRTFQIGEYGTCFSSSNSWSSMNQSTSEFTITLKDQIAWENVVIEVVVKDKTSSQSRKNARKLKTESELLTETVTEPQTNTTETTVPETTVTEEQATESPAPETQIPETESPQTQAPETNPPETSAPETAAPQTEPPAPETSAPQTKTPAPQTEPPAPETAAPQTEPPAPETSAPQTEPPAPETAAPQVEASAPPAETQSLDTQAAEGSEPVQDSGDS